MAGRRGPRTMRVTAVVLGCLLVWLGIAVPVSVGLFLNTTRTVTVASHEAELRPTFDSRLEVSTGPVIPDLRVPVDGPIGVHLTLGKTEADSLPQLMTRYGAIAATPEGQEAKIRQTVTSMAISAAERGAAIGLVAVLVVVLGWHLAGPARRRELWDTALARMHTWRGGAGAVLVVTLGIVVVAVIAQPWNPDDEEVDGARWVSLDTFLGGEIDLPPELDGVQVRGDVTTRQTRRLVESSITYYDDSKAFYADAVEAVDDLTLRTPTEDDTVVVLVSDRHDNIGMDSVVRAIAEKGGATAAYDAGDDTSTGSSWEDFSLDSLDAATADLDERFAVAGNHDHGDFTSAYLTERGWTMLEGAVVDGPGGTSLLGIPDPRSSGLGAWRDTGTVTFSEAENEVADIACASEKEGRRVTTVLVHDANLGRETLRRGCADLVLGGHTHVAAGPVSVVGENGESGHSYTTGTTGGAAYAFALGKPRRTAQVTLVTYRDGKPYGLQAVELQTNGSFVVHDFQRLE